MPRKGPGLYYNKAPGFYTMVHEPSGYFYIGSTSNVMIRIAKHRLLLRVGTHANPMLSKVYTTWEDFRINVNYTSTVEEARKIEDELIGMYLAYDKLCNVKGTRSHVDKPITGRQTDEARMKMSESSQKAVSINGVEYTSRRDAACALGVTAGAISWGIRKGTGKYTNWKDLSKKGEVID